MRRQEALDRERLLRVSEERKHEVERAREFRAADLAEKARIDEERRRIQAEKDEILKARQALEEKEKQEIERRDIMKMVRATAENVRGIVEEGQRQIEQEREVRQS